ncbi:hypothetical protein HNQ39_004981 [Armatimonas rosea]|uniref:Uncharacterized protein n=1 Tax=Armatimonas rosea TaxID=685828 RepID=A0A7W9W850_ARMRO|nr:hypothetical protein [Armatimonas rosea]
MGQKSLIYSEPLTSRGTRKVLAGLILLYHTFLCVKNFHSGANLFDLFNNTPH